MSTSFHLEYETSIEKSSVLENIWSDPNQGRRTAEGPHICFYLSNICEAHLNNIIVRRRRIIGGFQAYSLIYLSLRGKFTGNKEKKYAFHLN